MARSWPSHGSGSVLDYTMDWSRFLDSDTLSTATFSLDTAAGLTIADEENDTTSATVWLSGGTSGQVAEVRCTVTTTGGRTDYHTASLVIR